MKTRIAFLALILVTGCDGGSDKTPEQIHAEVAASQQAFALERQRIERENVAREARVAEQRGFIGVSFVSVDLDHIEVQLNNLAGRSIDNQSGSLEIFDTDGNYITGTGLTNWVPGDVYLPVDASQKAIKSLKLESAVQRNKMLAEAPSYQYYFTVNRIQFVGEDEINFLDNAASTIDPDISTPASAPEFAKPN